MVALRLDPRVAARVDPSDVVQDALAEADAGLGAFARGRPLTFYPWLRQLAADRVADLHRRHVRAACRTVERDEPRGATDVSVARLAARLAAGGPGPSEAARRAEQRDRVRAALLGPPGPDREALTLRYREDLPAAQVGGVLGVSEAAAKKRVVRALGRLRGFLTDDTEGGR